MAIGHDSAGAEQGVSRRPLFEIWPQLEGDAGFWTFGDFPTPVQPLAQLAPTLSGAGQHCYVKRDDLSSGVYGGNKVRTLESLFGQARREGARRVFATGAYGSNHAVATVLHAQKLGLTAGALLFPQPVSVAAEQNLRVCVERADELIDLWHWSALPFAMWAVARRERTNQQQALIMPPGGASPRGCLGFLSAALELAEQVREGLLPVPQEVVLALGSTCSTAGMLVGLRLAARLGIGWTAAPQLVAVRVTPWPVTSRYRILRLAERTLAWLARLTGERRFEFSRAELSAGLELDGSQLGRGYGHPTLAGRSAIDSLGSLAAALDTTYAAKSAAALIERIRRRPDCPRVYWSTKSSAPLPLVSADALASAPERMRRWLAKAAQES
jgi:D-cysteine desulfhydrase